MMIRRVWSAMCDDTCFTNILYTFAETMYIPELGAVVDLCSYYVVCMSGVHAQVHPQSFSVNLHFPSGLLFSDFATKILNRLRQLIRFM
jgi:hypothetical protein